MITDGRRALPRALSALFGAAAMLFGLDGGAPAFAQPGSICANPAAFCGRTVSPGCLNRVGAGALSVDESDACFSAFRTYRNCLEVAAASCPPRPNGDRPGPPNGPRAGADAPPRAADQPSAAQPGAPSPADVLAIWNAVKDSGDPDVLESFAESYPNGPLATLARSRAAALRGDASEDAGVEEPVAPDADVAAPEPASSPEPDAANDRAASRDSPDAAAESDAAVEAATEAAAWAAVGDTRLVSELDAFLAAHPSGANAVAARDRRATLLAEQLEAQGHLNRIGISVGRADGIWGPRSRRGLARFLAREGEARAEILTLAHLARLRAAPTPAPAPAPAPTVRETRPEPAAPSTPAPTAEPTPPVAQPEPAPAARQTRTARLTISGRTARGRSFRCRAETQARATSGGGYIVTTEAPCGDGANVRFSVDASGRVRDGRFIPAVGQSITINGSSYAYSGRTAAARGDQPQSVRVELDFRD